MAGKKKKTAAKRRRSRSHVNDKNRWITGIVVILLSIYAYYAFTTATPSILDRVIGKYLLMYLFGNAVPFLSLIGIAAGILILLDRFQFYKESIIYAVLVVLNLMVILSVNLSNLTSYTVIDLFSLPTTTQFTSHGGIFGIIIAYFLVRMISSVGTVLVMTALSLVEILLAIKSNFTDLFNKMDESNFGLNPIKEKVMDVSENIRQKQRAQEKEDAMRKSIEQGEPIEIEEDETEDYAPDDSILNLAETDDAEEPQASNFLERSDAGVISVETTLINTEDVKKALRESDDSGIIPMIDEEDERISQLRQADQGKTGEVKKNAFDLIPKKDYQFPSVELLTRGSSQSSVSQEEVKDHAKRIRETFRDFGVDAAVRGYEAGPSITRFEIKPAPGVKVSKITNLENDLALNLASSDIRIEAPIPGKDAVGIEVPNRKASTVTLRQIIDSEEFESTKAAIPFALGKTLSGKNIVGDIASMPHMLIAGATGSGKSVCINTMIISMLYKMSPDELKMIMIDPKMVELNQYNAIPHLLIPVVTDPKKAASALNWGIKEMTDRYELFKDQAVRDIETYNKLMEKTGGEKLPRIVIIIDELADLMMTSPKEVEAAICRLAQLARACGIHLVIATQRPSVDVITGLIKSNIPSRVAFSVASNTDSRTILDQAGAEKLLGKGDMLYKPVELSKPLRVQCCFVSDAEIARVIEAVHRDDDEGFNQEITDHIEMAAIEEPKKKSEKKRDSLFSDACEVAYANGQISTSMLQRRLGIGYARAGKIIDSMEEDGIISGPNGSKPRKLLLTREEYERIMH